MIEYERAKEKKYDSLSAARSIIPRNAPVPGPVPSMSRSPVRRLASPARWSELDRDIDPSMKGTGTLADPLLTLEERNTLRAKLATQMRGSARYYQPQTASSSLSRGSSPSSTWKAATPSPAAVDPTVDAPSSSHHALTKLQALTGRAQKQRHL